MYVCMYVSMYVCILDIEFATDEGRRWVDVTARHPPAGDAGAVRATSRKDGEASRKAERSKHKRSPGPQLTPFADEVGGRVDDAGHDDLALR